MSGMMALAAVTVRFSASAAHGGDRYAAKIGQVKHLLDDAAALLFKLI